MSKEKNKLVPRYRFPEFMIEEEWKLNKLSNVYSFITSNSFSRDDLNYTSGKAKNIHYGDIHTKFSTLFDITKEVVPFINESIPLDKFNLENYCKESDIIFADASEDLKDVGKSIELVNLNNEKLLSGLHTILARQKTSEIVVGFGGYLFLNDTIRKQIQRESQGAKVLGISATRLSNINIFYPKKTKEQQKIASCLSSLDEVITGESQKLDILKEHKKGLLQNLFPAEGETVPKFRFNEFENSEEWEEKRLGEICKITSGGTPSRTNNDYWNGEIPWISTTLIDFNTINTANECITEVGLQNSSAKIFPINTILMAMYGQGKTRGKVAVLGIEAATNQACSALLLKDGYNTRFVFQNLAGRYDEIRKLSNQGGQENLSAGLIENIPISIPVNPKEQEKIADTLSSIDDLINAQSQKIETLKLHKKGLLQGLFPKIVA